MTAPPLLVSGPCYAALWDPVRERLGILASGLGDYYGLSWSEDELFLLARQGGKGDLILVFNPEGLLLRTLPIGRDIDGHQILYQAPFLYVTATRENALLRLDPASGAQTRWNWTGHDTDVHHLNGLAPGPDGGLLVSQDNGPERPSEFVAVSPEGRLLGTVLTLTEPGLGSHNLEGSWLVASGADSVVYAIDEAEPRLRPVFRREQTFFRGLARCREPGGSDTLLVGASGLFPRPERSRPQTAWIHRVAPASPDPPLLTLELPGLGQVYDLRGLDPDRSHNGLPCPLRWDDPLGISTGRPARFRAGPETPPAGG